MGTFEDFCGSEFWDNDLTWNTSQPDFTPCFQHTVLVWVPCGFLWLVLPFYLATLIKAKGPAISVNTFNTLRTVVGMLICFTKLLDVLKAAGEFSQSAPPPLVDIVSSSIQTVTFIVATILVQLERTKGFLASGVLFLFYALQVLGGIIPFYSKILHVEDEGSIDDLYRFITFYVFYGLLLIQFILYCFADHPPLDPIYTNEHACPELKASFIGRLTFWWMNGLVIQGFKKPLEETDIFDPNPRDITRNNAPEFNECWQIELDRWKRKQDAQKPPYGRQISTNGRAPLLENGPVEAEVEIKDPKKDRGGPSLFKVLAKTFGSNFIRAWSCKIVYDVLQFVSPMILKLMVGFTEDLGMEVWKGYLFAALFFITTLVQSFFFHQVFHISICCGTRIKASVIAAIYKKALTMSNDARKDSTVGEIVNLMSVDAQRLQDVAGYLWMVFSAPLQIALAIWLLWNELGPSVLAGVGVMVLLIPINGVIAGKSRKLQITQMKLKDARVKLLNEVLNGIKVLKLYAWEKSFQDKISAIREKELVTLKKYAILSAIGSFFWTCAPFMNMVACFTVFVLFDPEHFSADRVFTAVALFNILRVPMMLLPAVVSYVITVTLACFGAFVTSSPENVLTSSKAFTSLSLFNILRFPMNLLPMMISYIITASVSIKRIGKFLSHEDLDANSVQHDENAPYPIYIEDGTFSWELNQEPILSDINVEIPDGALVAVVGQVGAGKSSLLSALLGEMVKVSGRVNVRGSVAYVAQQAWIQNATLKDNILFGRQMNESRYHQVIDACALKPDLAILQGGDMTEIGEKGINLSGGQKQRVSLARAVYDDSSIYYLDDPLSAVDSHVGKHIFDKVIGPEGMLKNKTRILVTHGAHWLPFVDQIIVLMDGRISEVGSYDELLSHDGPFAQFLKTYLLNEDEDEEEEEDPEIRDIKDRILQRVESVTSDAHSDTSDTDGRSPRRRSKSASSPPALQRALSRDSVKGEKKPEKLPQEKDKLIEDEKREIGKVRWTVILDYLSALRLGLVLPCLLMFVLYQAASVGANVWLSVWTEDPIMKNESIPTNSSDYISKRDFYLGIYGGLGVAQAAFVLLYAIGFALCTVLASRRMHLNMLANVLKGPMSFFDTTPIGRIVNRFSRDIETIDNILPQTFKSYINTLFTVISTVVVISYSTPVFLAVVVPIAIIYVLIQKFYIPTSRQLKRIESTTRSPIYVHFSETITGASTIRAYMKQAMFITTSEEQVDKNLVYYFTGNSANRWLGFRLEFIGGLVVFSAALFAVLGRGTITGGIVGLSISYALQVTGSLNWMVRMSSDLETNIVSVERVKEYAEIETEAEWYSKDNPPPNNWPATGQVDFDNFSVRYRPGLDLVLRGVNFHINGGERVGIVGRTGAGKSSLTVSLFRLIEAAGGQIVIDGCDIARMGLHQLRSKLTILPQDPVLFSGTLRMNLDPFDEYSDAQIWNSLENAHLKKFVGGKSEGLLFECGEGGQNLSVGQRQLVCLARTLLRKTKILILDEATAAVDLETDDLIQRTIQTEFADCTILTIAHRLNTIMDYDRVMVLDAGKVKEFDSPSNLLKDRKSVFHGMAKDAGLV